MARMCLSKARADKAAEVSVSFGAAVKSCGLPAGISGHCKRQIRVSIPLAQPSTRLFGYGYGDEGW